MVEMVDWCLGAAAANCSHSVEDGEHIVRLLMAREISGLPLDFLEAAILNIPLDSQATVLANLCLMSVAEVNAIVDAQKLNCFELAEVP